MKIIILVVLIALAVQISGAGPEDWAKIMAECKASEKPTDLDLANLRNKVKPATKEMKCLVTCFGEKLGKISNNQISAEGTMKFVKTMPNVNEKTIQGMNEVIEECKGVQDADRCEFGYKAMDCMRQAAAKRSLNNVFM